VTIGRVLEETGAHAYGHNVSGIGVCMIGTDKFTQAQWHSLTIIVNALQRKIPEISIKGHRDLSPDLNHDGIIEQNYN